MPLFFGLKPDKKFTQIKWRLIMSNYLLKPLAEQAVSICKQTAPTPYSNTASAQVSKERQIFLAVAQWQANQFRQFA